MEFDDVKGGSWSGQEGRSRGRPVAHRPPRAPEETMARTQSGLSEYPIHQGVHGFIPGEM
jgi:hypothetical protein